MTDNNPEATQAPAGNPGQAPGPQGGVAPPPRRGRPGMVLLALLIGLGLGGVAGRYAFEAYSTHQYDVMKLRLESELAVTHTQLAEAQAKADVLSGNLLVEQSTSKGLAASLEVSQAELGQVRDQLAFFDQLFPPGPQGVVNIRALEAEVRGQALHYRALFMRKAKPGDAFEGRMEFVAQGKVQGKTVKVILEPARGMLAAAAGAVANSGGAAIAAEPATAGSAAIAADVASAGGAASKGKAAQAGPGDGVPPAAAAAQADSRLAGNGGISVLHLKFDEFQRSIGLLTLPEGFEPERLTLNVLEDDAVRATRTINISAGD